MSKPLSGEAGGYRIFWGDTHHNTYQHYQQDPPLTDVLAFASTHLDFYTGAYYTPVFTPVPPLAHVAGRGEAPEGGHICESPAAGAVRWQGVRTEGLRETDAIEREWAGFEAATAHWNRPGEFVAFPGYEWQGDARWGDHNVVYRSEGGPVLLPDTLAELYDGLRGRDALAIPHHTGYLPGQRAPMWSACDETISPFTEIFSIHGCSETDEEWIGLRHNSHMGPGTGGGTYQDALDRGLHLGAIGSTDNWTNMPGHWGQGLAACLADELSRDALWQAFRARRVYGVTGDRIGLNFTVNGQPMGSILEHAPKRTIRAAVRGCDAIDRIEILRNGRVLATHCHQGAWRAPAAGERTRFKLRVEAGWGPRLGEIPLGEHPWHGRLSVAGGRMIGWQPAWVTRGQGVPELAGDTATFSMVSHQHYVAREAQNATIFEFEAASDAALRLSLNGLEARGRVQEFADRSRILWYRDECVERVRAATGLEPDNAGRGDTYYHNACKAKLHRAIPEAAYTATFEIVDDEPLTAETHYRVRVEQRNAQRAWSSPIWVRPPA